MMIELIKKRQKQIMVFSIAGFIFFFTYSIFQLGRHIGRQQGIEAVRVNCR